MSDTSPAPAGGDARTALSAIRHGLRTPINIIIGYAELMIEDAEDSGQPALTPDLQEIAGQGRQALAAVDRLLAEPSGPDDIADRSGLPAALLPPIDHIRAACSRLRGQLAEADGAGPSADLGRIEAATEQLRALVAQAAPDRLRTDEVPAGR
ncbi:MAG: hypothetical protein IRY99_01635 [Isosphaeraceae bacterium]|nr:hypothetical protein [Isosphaeraceae bacterium]